MITEQYSNADTINHKNKTGGTVHPTAGVIFTVGSTLDSTGSNTDSAYHNILLNIFAKFYNYRYYTQLNNSICIGKYGF